MRAIQYTQYGPASVLSIEHLDRLSPKADELLIKIHAASVTRADTMMRRGYPFFGRLILGLTKPKYSGIGTGFAGEVEEVGKAVKQFKPGDFVFGESVFGSGTNAEYVCVSEGSIIALKPENLSFEEACCACDGAMTSLNFLRDVGKLQQHQQVLIIGASGSLGSAAVQIGKQLGAQVSAVCSGSNSDWVKSLGADRVIDYTKEDFAQAGKRYDMIFDTTGKYSFSQCRAVLNANGSYLTPVLTLRTLLLMLWTNYFSRQKVKFSATGLRPAKELRDMLAELKSMFEAKQLQSVIDKRYSLEDAPKAHAYVDKGHKKGNVVLVM